MPKLEKEIVIKNRQGLHARPAAMFVQIVSKYNSHIIVRKGMERVNGKSIMGILTLGAERNSRITIEAEGEDAPEVLAELADLLTKEMG
jgi:phosphocarrier protein